jgi:hypothetical protein
MSDLDREIAQPPMPSNMLLDRLLGEQNVDPEAIQGVVDEWMPRILQSATERPEERPRWDHKSRVRVFATSPHNYTSPVNGRMVQCRAKLAFGPRNITEESVGVVYETINLEALIGENWLPVAVMSGHGSQRPADDSRDAHFMWEAKVIAEEAAEFKITSGSALYPPREGSTEELFAFVDVLKRLV